MTILKSELELVKASYRGQAIAGAVLDARLDPATDAVEVESRQEE